MSVGAILADITKPPAGSVVTRIEYTYDVYSDLETVKYYDGDRLLFTLTNTYDEQHRIIKTERES